MTYFDNLDAQQRVMVIDVLQTMVDSLRQETITTIVNTPKLAEIEFRLVSLVIDNFANPSDLDADPDADPDEFPEDEEEDEYPEPETVREWYTKEKISAKSIFDRMTFQQQSVIVQNLTTKIELLKLAMLEAELVKRGEMYLVGGLTVEKAQTNLIHVIREFLGDESAK